MKSLIILARPVMLVAGSAAPAKITHHPANLNPGKEPAADAGLQCRPVQCRRHVVWREVKLTIVEDGDTLRGSIFSRGWDGGAADGKPGVLADGTFDGFMITETAIGRTDGKRVNFRALTIDKREGSQEYLDRGYALRRISCK